MQGVDLRTCVVQLQDPDGRPRGAGFVLSPTLAVTCVHVVENCMAGPGEKVQLVFQISQAQAKAEVLADGWHPAADIAFLQLPHPLPTGVQVAPIGLAAGSDGDRWLSFGFPEDGSVQARRPQGRINGLVPVDELQFDLLQIQGAEVDLGMSGAPLLDLDMGCVIGMIAGYKGLDRPPNAPQVRYAYAIPIEALVEQRGDLDFRTPNGPSLPQRPSSVPFQVPAVPRYFVERPDVSHEIKAQLFPEQAPHRGALVVSAVYGLGGIGKTTLVAALAHEPELQRYFIDGVLWTTLGHEPDLLALSASWIQSLNDYDFHPITVDGATAHLRTLLHNKSCLLVVDDAWKAEHVRPFLVASERSRVLVTTRDATLARRIGGSLCYVDVMTEDQALALFKGRLGPLGHNREIVQSLVKRLGYLPLAIELTAAQVEAGTSFSDLVEFFEREMIDLSELDYEEVSARNESLRLTFQLSFDSLVASDRDALFEMGVLAQEARVNSAMLSVLWKTEEGKSRTRLRRLRDKALLKLVGSDIYVIPDLLHAEIRHRLLQRTTMVRAHKALVESYRRRLRDGLWQTLPDDGYVHNHLAWHLEHAEEIETLHTLLREEGVNGGNGWYHARERLGQTAGYLTDVLRGWKLSEEEYAHDAQHSTVGLQCRYALVVASLNSMAKNLPTELVVALVKNGVWSPVQALAYVRRVPVPAQRVEAILCLVPHLTEELREEAIEGALLTAQTIRQGAIRAKVLVELLAYVRYEKEDMLQDALTSASTITDLTEKAQCLSTMAKTLAQQAEVSSSIAALREIENPRVRMATLTEVASHFANLGLIDEAATTTLMIEDKAVRTESLLTIIPVLPESQKPKLVHKALELARAISSPEERAYALTRLAVHLPPEIEMLVFREAVDIEKASQEWGTRVGVIARILCHLPNGLREEAIQEVLERADTIDHMLTGTRALREFLSHVSSAERQGLLQTAIERAQEIESAHDRARILSDLAPYADGDTHLQVLEHALDAARKVYWPDDRAKLLCRLSIQLAESGYFNESAEIAREISGTPDEAELLSSIALHLPPEYRDEVIRRALAATNRIRNVQGEISTFKTLALRWAQIGLAEEAVSTAQKITRERMREDTLSDVALRLANSADLSVALAVTERIQDRHIKVLTLTQLAHTLPDTQVDEILRRALGEAQKVGDTASLASSASTLIPRLVEVVPIEDALQVARNVPDARAQANAIAGIALHLAVLGRDRDSLRLVRDIEEANLQMETLAKVVAQIARHGNARIALQAASNMEPEMSRAKAMAGIAPFLDPELANNAWRAVCPMKDERAWTEAVIALIPRLPVELLAEVAELAQSKFKKKSEVYSLYARVLSKLAERLVEVGRPENALATVQEIREAASRAETILELMPGLSMAGRGEEALQMVRKIRRNLARSQALEISRIESPEVLLKLSKLTRNLPLDLSEELEEAYAVARGTSDPYEKVFAFARVAPYFSAESRDTILAEAREIASNINDTVRQCTALTLLVSLFEPPTKKEVLTEAFEKAQSIRNTSDRLFALIPLVPHLTNTGRRKMMIEVLRLASTVRDERDRIQALEMLTASASPILPEQVLELVKSIENDYYRARALVSAVHDLPSESLDEVLLICKGLDMAETRIQVWASLSPRLAQIPLDSLYPMWQSLIRSLASRSRQDLVSDLQGLEPVIAAIGGAEAVGETIRSIQDIGHWWP